jgi:hypothetical protein
MNLFPFLGGMSGTLNWRTRFLKKNVQWRPGLTDASEQFDTALYFTWHRGITCFRDTWTPAHIMKLVLSSVLPKSEPIISAKMHAAQSSPSLSPSRHKRCDRSGTTDGWASQRVIRMCIQDVA